MQRNYKRILNFGIFLSWTIMALPAHHKLTLMRGGVGDESFRYWAVEDTYINKDEFEFNYGRHPFLLGGPNKTILIRFGDLERVIGRNKVIKQARIILTCEKGQTAHLTSISRVLTPWSEGSGFRGFFFHRPLIHGLSSLKTNDKNVYSQDKQTQHTETGANWNFSKPGPFNQRWNQPGATGSKDVISISKAKLSQTAQTVVIEGLENEIQDMKDRWYTNYGFAIKFKQNIDFSSSDYEFGKPQLEIETEDIPSIIAPKISLLTIESSWDKSEVWPKDKDSLTYIATIKNNTNESLNLSDYNANWYYREKLVKSVTDKTLLKPNSTAQFAIDLPFTRHEYDARIEPIRFVIEGKNNNQAALEIDQNAFPIAICLHQSTYDQCEKLAQADGFAGVEDWLQHTFRFWNETLMAQSRFSFAPEGCTQRMRLQTIKKLADDEIVPTSIQGAMSVWTMPKDFLHVQSSSSTEVNQKHLLRNLLFALNTAIGLPDLSKMNLTSDSVQLNDEKINIIANDRNPGLMQGGDTRDERSVGYGLSLNYEKPDSISAIIDCKKTDLYSATSVAILQTMLGKGENFADAFQKLVPDVVMIKAQSNYGQSINDATLEFYQKQNGSFENAKLIYTAKTDSQGLAILPKISVNNSTEMNSYFGNLDNAYEKGLLLVRAKSKNSNDWSSIKAWHFVDNFARGSRRAAIIPMEFSLPLETIKDENNLALNKLVTDAKDSMPAKLAALVTDHSNEEVSLQGEKDHWVEIDLGRDRPIGRVSLDVVDKQLWPKFDIMLYQTGQTPSQAIRWAKEENSKETLNLKGKSHSQNSKISTIHYHGPAYTARFIRLVNCDHSKIAKLTNIKVYPIVIDTKESK